MLQLPITQQEDSFSHQHRFEAMSDHHDLQQCRQRTHHFIRLQSKYDSPNHEMNLTVRFCMRRCRASLTSSSDRLSNAEVASSKMRIDGFWYSARAIASLIKDRLGRWSRLEKVNELRMCKRSPLPLPLASAKIRAPRSNKSLILIGEAFDEAICICSFSCKSNSVHVDTCQ